MTISTTQFYGSVTSGDRAAQHSKVRRAGRKTNRSRRISALPTVLFAIDLAVLAISTWLALTARQSLPWFSSDGHELNELLFPVTILLFVLWPMMVFLTGGYSALHMDSGASSYTRVLHATFYTAGLLAVTAYLWQYPLSRGYFVLLFTVAPALLLLTRYLMRRALHAARTRGQMLSPVLLAGNATHVNDLHAVLRREPWLGYRPVGMLLRNPVSDDGPSLPILGTPRDCLAAVRQSGATTVIFAEGSFDRAGDFNQLAVELENIDVHTVIVPSLAEISPARMTVRPVAGLPLMHIDRPQAQRASSWSKRLFDIVGSAIALLLFSPIILISTIAIKLSDGGPILFRQPRVGFKGKEFECLKLRTMVVNAEQLRSTLETKNESDGPLFKMGEDPRITRPGRWLRRYSIDEMPQFWNVLVGEMSLIGPRPALRREVDVYEEHVLRRLDVRPGITGLWQVSGRSNLSWEETVRLDLYYVNNWSLGQDLQILLRTVKAVLRGTGAY